MALGKPMLMAHLPFLFAHPTHPKKCVFSPGGVLVARDYEPLTPAGVSGAAGLGGMLEACNDQQENMGRKPEL